MTPLHKTAYRLFALTVLLLVVYAGLALLTALKFLPGDPLAGSLPYQHTSPFANITLQLAILTGLSGGGLYILSVEGPTDARGRRRLLDLIGALWPIVIGAGLLTGLLGVFEGRAGLELPPLIDLLLAAVLALTLIYVAEASRRRSAVLFLWSVGLMTVLVGLLFDLFPAGDLIGAGVLRALALGLITNIGQPLAALALLFWCMHRFSNVTLAWVTTGLHSTGGLLAIAGALITVPSLYTLGITPPPGWLALLGALFVLAAWLILAAHGYRALADRNPNATLAAHWTTLALLLFLLGPALLGGLQIMPDARAYTQGTRLTDLQHTLTLLAVVAAVLATINQASAELRGRNQRVTGFIPLWLVGFGLVGATLALGGAGIAQVYLERVLSVGYLETQTLIAPLYALWTLSLLLVTLGLAAYALGFWARRPVERQWVDRV